MSTGWAQTTKILATMALAATGALSIGCGPSPAYEPEPRMPTGYTQQPGEPLTSEELAARAEAVEAARAQAAGEIAVGTDDDDDYSDTDPSALTEFKPALDGHGTWVDDTTYGTVWVPSAAEVGTDFVPYTTAGRWTYEEGAPRSDWVWVSDYSWGWAPFHYGRWVNVSRHGWVWIPGRTYSGAWVTWRVGSPGYSYIGWGPSAPSWYWYNGTAVGWTHGWSPYYSYCHRDHVYSPAVANHVVRGPAAREHESRTVAFVPASPQVGGGGRVGATPTVGGSDRTAAIPSVGGRAPAMPTVGGARAGANPRVGPRPDDLGIGRDAIVAPPRDNAGLARAQVLASPQTAVSQGAAAPVGARRYNPDAVVAGATPRTFASPSYSNRNVEAAARAPQVRGVTPLPPRQSALPETRPTPRTFAPYASAPPSPGYAGPPAAYRSSPTVSPSISVPPPSYRSQPSVAAQPQPQFRSSPSISSPPLYSPPLRSTPSVAVTPQYRSSPSVSSPPVFRSSPSVSSPPPSFRSTPSAPTFRSSPSVSSPTFRSSPTPARPSVRSRR